MADRTPAADALQAQTQSVPDDWIGEHVHVIRLKRFFNLRTPRVSPAAFLTTCADRARGT